MRKFAVLMVVCGLIVSASAETYQVTDYLTDPGLDNPIEGDWDFPDGWIYDGNPIEYVVNQTTDWTPMGFTWWDGRFIVDMGEDAYNGTQALGLATNSAYMWMGVGIFPDQDLHTGDTWEFDFAVKALDDPLYPSGDVWARISIGGADYAAMQIPAAEITGDWVVYHYSETYNGLVQPWAGGWAFQVLMDIPRLSDWGGVYIDLVVPEPKLLEGDANRDGVVSAGDYASVQSNFGNTGTPGILGDANGDGVVSAGDYASVQSNFGNTAAAVIPEPATMGLMAIGCVALLKRKRNV